MRANEGGIGDGFGLVDDVWQLPFGGGRRFCLLLAIGKTGHFQLDLGFGHKRADFRQAEAGAEAIKRNHASLLISKTGPSLATACCHRGVSSSNAGRDLPPPAAYAARGPTKQPALAQWPTLR